MSTIYIEPTPDAAEVLLLVRSAIKSEIVKLELALKMATQRVKPFEQKYGVTSVDFMAHMTAEDLAGGDEEYVHWAGEYKLRQRLEEKLTKLQAITYDHPKLL